MHMAKGRQFSFRKRLGIYWRDQFTCVYCHTPIHPLSEELTIDHVEPDGGDEDSNLVTACRSCNSAKGARPVRDMVSRAGMAKFMEATKPGFATEQAIELAISTVCQRWHVERINLLSPRRSVHLVQARAELGHRLRDMGVTYMEIARLLGKKDHSTIVHLLKRYPQRHTVPNVV